MWLSKLPPSLQTKVGDYVAQNPASEPIFGELVNFLSPDPPKKRKVGRPRKDENSRTPPPLMAYDPDAVLTHTMDIKLPIDPSEIIFEMPSMSFISPYRRRMNLVFHLLVSNDAATQPLLSVASATTKIPEFTIKDLLEAVKLCVMIPMLGNSTVSTKKDTAMLCIWLHDGAFLTQGKNEPIICTINLDAVKRQLIDEGKLPEDADQILSPEELRSIAIKPVNEMIIEFLERQFQLCGVRLVNYMPSMDPRRNALNMNEDTAICISRGANSVNDFVNVAAYRGAKEGALVLIADLENSAYLCFGFKKPVLLYDFGKVVHVSYKDIAKFTFTVLVTIRLQDDHQEVLEFTMVDQRCFHTFDEFFKSRQITDGSFDEQHREKRAEDKKSVKNEEAGEGNLGELALDQDDDEDEDEEEEDDETYTGAVEGEGSSGSESGSEDEDMSDDEAEKNGDVKDEAMD